MSIRALIFDFDGLILDTESTEYQSWQELFTDHGCQLSLDLWVDCIGRPRGYFDFYTHLEEMRGTAIDREQIRTQRHTRVRDLNFLQPIQPGVVKYLQDARELGLKIGLASSSSRVWVHGHLERLSLYEYFTVTKCVEDTGTHKPDPGPYLAALDALNVLPGEAVAFEDSPNGISLRQGGWHPVCCRSKPYDSAPAITSCRLSTRLVRLVVIARTADRTDRDRKSEVLRIFSKPM